MDWLSFPTWMAEILKQFPVLVLCGIVLWRATVYLDRRHAASLKFVQTEHESHRKTATELTGRHIEDLKSQHAAQVGLMQNEIDRLVVNLSDATKERDRLLRRIAPDNSKE